MQLTINEDRSVKIEDDVWGTIGENKAEVLEFIFPTGFENYHKTIEIQTSESKFVDNIENDRYELTYAITKYKKVKAQIVSKDLENDIVFKSEKFDIEFKESINASEELVEEKRVIIEKIIADVEDIKEKTKGLVNYDDTELKSEINSIKTNVSNIETEINNISSLLDSVNGEVV